MSSFGSDLGAVGTGATQFDASAQSFLASPTNLLNHH